MEFVGTKRSKKRKRKRRINSKQQRREKIKFEVRSGKHRRKTEQIINIKKEKLISNTMEASDFWENYKAGHEWQNRYCLFHLIFYYMP